MQAKGKDSRVCIVNTHFVVNKLTKELQKSESPKPHTATYSKTLVTIGTFHRITDSPPSLEAGISCHQATLRGLIPSADRSKFVEGFPGGRPGNGSHSEPSETHCLSETGVRGRSDGSQQFNRSDRSQLDGNEGILRKRQRTSPHPEAPNSYTDADTDSPGDGRELSGGPSKRKKGLPLPPVVFNHQDWFLYKLRVEEGLDWDKAAAKFNNEFGGHLELSALQMRLTRLKRKGIGTLELQPHRLADAPRRDCIKAQTDTCISKIRNGLKAKSRNIDLSGVFEDGRQKKTDQIEYELLLLARANSLEQQGREAAWYCRFVASCVYLLRVSDTEEAPRKEPRRWPAMAEMVNSIVNGLLPKWGWKAMLIYPALATKKYYFTTSAEWNIEKRNEVVNGVVKGLEGDGVPKELEASSCLLFDPAFIISRQLSRKYSDISVILGLTNLAEPSLDGEAYIMDGKALLENPLAAETLVPARISEINDNAALGSLTLEASLGSELDQTVDKGIPNNAVHQPHNVPGSLLDNASPNSTLCDVTEGTPDNSMVLPEQSLAGTVPPPIHLNLAENSITADNSATIHNASSDLRWDEVEANDSFTMQNASLDLRWDEIELLDTALRSTDVSFEVQNAYSDPRWDEMEEDLQQLLNATSIPQPDISNTKENASSNPRV
ncbi:hypothetical protein K432DRAFT_409710 [Lepidopterella palustris CBS 459.81]|uniref:Uncharacterized protein n=1 Tax=Lepidopterella palustris CBS 459.81 TaxID=1314670 RepID=A0A8E2J9T1_9PEZI|nr:hypothetical protein K432DRAFT_409710 [Lepidopterella palustris CBS 459.81]